MGELSMPTQGVGRSSLSPSTAVGTPLRICSPPVPTEEAPGGSAPRHILPTHRTPERGCPGTCRPSGRGKVPPASPCHPSQPREAAPLLRLFPGGERNCWVCVCLSLPSGPWGQVPGLLHILHTHSARLSTCLPLAAVPRLCHFPPWPLLTEPAVCLLARLPSALPPPSGELLSTQGLP